MNRQLAFLHFGQPPYRRAQGFRAPVELGLLRPSLRLFSPPQPRAARGSDGFQSRRDDPRIAQDGNPGALGQPSRARKASARRIKSRKGRLKPRNSTSGTSTLIQSSLTGLPRGGAYLTPGLGVLGHFHAVPIGTERKAVRRELSGHQM